MMDVGRNLTLTSEQDSDRYDSKQQNASAGGSFTFGSMSGSASVSLSQDRMHSNYDSVVEQTGIFAGKGGYDITVGGHTQLDGAVTGSTATADKNRLDTGTLGWGISTTAPVLKPNTRASGSAPAAASAASSRGTWPTAC
jgi:filamentous hemagglutinin